MIMTVNFRASLTATFCVAYVVLLSLDSPLFLYYPLTGEWAFRQLEGNHGPAMQWYGLLMGAVIAATVVSLSLSLLNIKIRLEKVATILMPVAMLACVYFMRGFFIY